MSAKFMGLVWECQLPFNKAWVLMAMADHADHEGCNVFPSLPLVAWKTGYSFRQIKRIVADLRDDGILIPYSETQGGVKIYRIELRHVLRKPEYVAPKNGRPVGVLEIQPRKTQGQIDTGFYVPHNRHSSNNSNSSSLTSLNSKCNYELPFDEFDFSQDSIGGDFE